MTLAPGAAWSVGTTSVDDMDDMKVDAKRNAKLDAMRRNEELKERLRWHSTRCMSSEDPSLDDMRA